MIISLHVKSAFHKQQQKEPLLSHEVPERLLQKVGADLCQIAGHSYLVYVDCFSNFAEVDYLSDTKIETIIHKIKMQFSRHGIPDIVLLDIVNSL